MSDYVCRDCGEEIDHFRKLHERVDDLRAELARLRRECETYRKALAHIARNYMNRDEMVEVACAALGDDEVNVRGEAGKP